MSVLETSDRFLMIPKHPLVYLAVILFFIPSRPAKSNAASRRYMFAVGSGTRYSTLLLFSLPLEYIGILTADDLLPIPQHTFTGASKSGTSLLYELVVGLDIAHSASA